MVVNLDPVLLREDELPSDLEAVEKLAERLAVGSLELCGGAPQRCGGTRTDDR